MNVISTIAKAGFAATEAQVEALATHVAQGAQADGTYLKVLVVAVQAELTTNKRKPGKRQQVAAINAVHGRFYPHVLKGVGADDIKQPERNRRATFARTAASTLRTFVRDGGQLRDVVAAETSKAKLLRGHQPVVPTGTRIERALVRATDAVVRIAIRAVKANPEEARERIDAAITALEGVRATLPALKAVARVRRGSGVEREVRAH